MSAFMLFKIKAKNYEFLKQLKQFHALFIYIFSRAGESIINSLKVDMKTYQIKWSNQFRQAVV